jgi:hypothetical protein
MRFAWLVMLAACHPDAVTAPPAPPARSAQALLVRAPPRPLLEREPVADDAAEPGAIFGEVTNTTGAPLAGVTVVAAGITAITDDAGRYRIEPIDNGPTDLAFYYAHHERSYPLVVDGEISFDLQLAITIGAIQGVVKDQTGEALPGVTVIIDTTNAGGETIQVETKTSIDDTPTAEGITLDNEYIQNIPVPGRTFEGVLGAAAGSQGAVGGE